MKIYIGNQEITLIPEEVRAARKMVLKFMETVDEASKNNNAPTMYFTTLLMMHVMSADQLEMLTPESLQKIMEVYYSLHDEE